MEDTFLEDQFRQLNDIFESYKTDIENLDSIVQSWEELSIRDPEELSNKIKSKIINKTSITLQEDSSGNLLLELDFHPIKVAWVVENQKL